LFRGGPQKIDDFETRWIVVTSLEGHWGLSRYWRTKRLRNARYDLAKANSLVEDHQDDINKLAEGGLVILSDLINDTCFIEIGWMVIEKCNDASPLEPVQT